jgi:REP element-mobilizing transposase RayT
VAAPTRTRGRSHRHRRSPSFDHRQPPDGVADTQGVTLPRKLLPASSYLVTRRVAQRVFLTKPDTLCNQVMQYCFARALELHPGIELHALQVLSDHYHAVLTDRDASLPELMAWVDRESAKALNKHYARAENLWCSEPYSSVELHDPEVVWGKTVYVFTNAVKHRLVRDYRDWPGVRSTPRDWLSGPKTIERPSIHFSQKDERWAKVELRFTTPPQFRDRDPELLVRDMQAAIEERQRELREEARREGRSFLGAERVLKESPFAQPKSPHVKGRLNPTFAAGTAEGHKRAREQRKSFLGAYREALTKLMKGLDCIFPAGSYKWPRLFAVPCAGLETGACSMDSS